MLFKHTNDEYGFPRFPGIYVHGNLLFISVLNHGKLRVFWRPLKLTVVFLLAVSYLSMHVIILIDQWSSWMLLAVPVVQPCQKLWAFDFCSLYIQGGFGICRQLQPNSKTLGIRIWTRV